MTLRLALDPGRATLRWWRDGAEQKPLVAVGRSLVGGLGRIRRFTNRGTEPLSGSGMK